MSTANKPEVWLRGPVTGIIPLLQPVVHALLQAQEEINSLMQDFDDAWLWQRPANMASAAFHLQHLTGVLDRLFTYARGEALTTAQLQYLAAEGKNETAATRVTAAALVNAFNNQLQKSFEQLQQTTAADLLQPRGVGRAKLPSTVAGLLFHAAEHTQRHLGQLLVTVKVVMEQKNKNGHTL